MLVTLETSQLFKFRLNVVAPLNIDAIFFKLVVIHPEISELKASASLNISFILVTFETSQLLIS